MFRKCGLSCSLNITLDVNPALLTACNLQSHGGGQFDTLVLFSVKKKKKGGKKGLWQKVFVILTYSVYYSYNLKLLQVLGEITK